MLRECSVMSVQVFVCLYMADGCSDLIRQERVVGSIANAPHFSVWVRVVERGRSLVWQKGGLTSMADGL